MPHVAYMKEWKTINSEFKGAYFYYATTIHVSDCFPSSQSQKKSQKIAGMDLYKKWLSANLS